MDVIEKTEKGKSEIVKKGVDWMKFLLKILSTVVSGIIIAFVGLYIWEQQNMTTQQQKMYDTKIEIFKQLTSDVTKMIYYSEFIIRTQLELRQHFDNIHDSADFAIYDKQMEYHLIVQKEKPNIYAENMKGLEFQSTFSSTILMTQIIFEPYPEFDTLQYLFSTEAIKDEVLLANNNESLNISTINKENIVNSIREKQKGLLEKILKSLFYQIKYPEELNNKKCK